MYVKVLGENMTHWDSHTTVKLLRLDNKLRKLVKLEKKLDIKSKAFIAA